MPDASTTLYVSGRVSTPDDPGATALLVRDGAIAWAGRDPGPHRDGADRVVDLGGALLLPAFVDAHVHSTSTGLALTGLDLTGVSSLAACLDRVERAGRSSRGRVVLGHGWDETEWPEARPPTRQELDRASYGGVVYLSRIDVHSAVVSSALLAIAPEARGAAGFDENGHLTRDAHHVVRRVARESVTPSNDGPSSARHWTAPPRWASAACTSWPGLTSAASTTCARCRSWSPTSRGRRS